MNLSSLIKYLENANSFTLSVFLLIILSLVQISPIKINPWSAISRFLKNHLGYTDIAEKIDKMQEETQKGFEALKENNNKRFEKIERDKAKSDFYELRKEILLYARECKKEIIHSESEREEIHRAIKAYLKLCDKWNFENGKVDEEIELIKERRDESYLKLYPSNVGKY